MVSACVKTSLTDSTPSPASDNVAFCQPEARPASLLTKKELTKINNTTTAQSARAAVAYFILQDIWAHLICRQGADEALAIINNLKTQHMSEADEASYLAIRGFWGWKHVIDLKAWGEDLDASLPEASCEGCSERLSCCQCDAGWNSDLCIAGNSARAGLCGDPLCLCANEVAE
jgi:hypothetical protein